jgi:glycosyltransferase involved in cell wall biosynthesis
VKKPIKVLHFIPTLSSGGAERQLVNLVTSTDRDLIEHVVCTIKEPDFFAPAIREAGYEIVDLGIEQKRPIFRAANAFRSVVAKHRPDIVHTWLYDANVSARLASLLRRRLPFVTSLQLPDYEPDAARFSNWNPVKVFGLRQIDKFTATLKRPHFVPCSEFVKKSYQQYFGIPDERATVIYNSINPETLESRPGRAEEMRRSLGLPDDAFLILNVGRLDPQKNHPLMFEGLKRAAAAIPNGYLLLAGAGPLEAKLKRDASEMGIGERVRFLGRREDVADLLGTADVFLFPSLFEGLPVALIEAMYKGLPVITSRSEVLSEVVDDGRTGLLVDPNSAHELENALVKLYSDPGLREKLGAAAHEEAITRFSVADTTAKWESLYKSIHKGRSA